MMRFLTTADGTFQWPAVTALLAIAALIFGAVGGSWAQSLGLRADISDVRTVDAVQEVRITVLEEQSRDMKKTNEEILRILQAWDSSRAVVIKP